MAEPGSIYLVVHNIAKGPAAEAVSYFLDMYVKITSRFKDAPVIFVGNCVDNFARRPSTAQLTKYFPEV